MRQAELDCYQTCRNEKLIMEKKMKNKKLFEKAYSRLNELYGGDYSTPDVVILSRFYREKMILGESELYMRYLDFLGNVRARAEDKGEHITCLEARKHFAWYLRGVAYASYYKEQISSIQKMDDIYRIADGIRKDLQ